MMLERAQTFDQSVADKFETASWDMPRQNFALFRRCIHPWGWWVHEIADELQQFFVELIEGKRPRLAIFAPPQHGKSRSVTDFIAWVAGQNPDLKTIFASFSGDLGERTNIDLQRTFNSDSYLKIFGRTRIGIPGWKCTTDLIEYCDYRGSFRNTVNGMELHLGVIDDPVKGRQEASSKTIRDRTWNWFVDDFMGRFHRDAGLLLIQTRWHVDDLAGRFLQRYADNVKVLSYPAIAEVDEIHRLFDFQEQRYKRVTRKHGQSLFEEWKPLDFLLDQKKGKTIASWESLYQQRPIVVGGGELPIEKLQLVGVWSTRDTSEVQARCRYWDEASSLAADASYTAGVLMHRMKNGKFVISDVVHGADDREKLIKRTAEADKKIYKNYEIGIEQPAWIVRHGSRADDNPQPRWLPCLR
jgi:hypothetical protein